MYQLVGYIIVLPLLGFLINGLLGKKIGSERLSGVIGSGAVGLSFAAALLTFVEMMRFAPQDRLHIVTMFNWIAAGALRVDIAYQVDQLSVVMMLIVTGVGFLIHVYSIGYMKGDRAVWRFFAYLNLFIFMMLNLVLADSFLLMFLGWEGVGLCSFLLIGFWHDRLYDTGGYRPGTATTSDAAKKAFIVNRIGDFGFLIAMLLMFDSFGSLVFQEVFSRAAIMIPGDTKMFWITLLLFVGATGKSAQIPLYIWLPDAMAGPAPVSALIHAATMVTAGVYMVARCAVLYSLSPATMQIVAAIGIATAFFAATMALVQNDIKKILAYSTISQLGYMFLGLGVGSFAAAIFHLMTHAFFKALLFLGAGAVIHAMHDVQDIQMMGGLKSRMPVTYKTFLVAGLAIAGIPPLSGFFSKDEILWRTYEQGSIVYWCAAWITAGLTAFYMFRLISLAFEGNEPRIRDHHAHEAPGVMTVPLILLAVFSTVAGAAGIPVSLGGGNALERWLEPVFEKAKLHLPPARDSGVGTEYIFMGLSVAAAVAGIYYARKCYLIRLNVPARISKAFGGLYNLLWNKYYIDEAYDAVLVTPLVKGSDKLLWKRVDNGLIEGIVNGAARMLSAASERLRRIQSGVTQSYAFVFVVGIVVILGILMFR